jgi:hypothetical protein
MTMSETPVPKQSPPGASATPLRRLAIALVLLLAGGAAVFALLRSDPWGDRGNAMPAGLSLDLEAHFHVKPALLRFMKAGEIAVPMQHVRGIAVGPQDRICVAGDQAVHIFARDGSPERVLVVKGQPRCVAVGGAHHFAPGRIYVGTGRQIELFAPDGTPAGIWSRGLTGKTLLTSLATAEHGLFAADAGMRVVIRYDEQGEVVGQIGRRDPSRQMPGFIIPSPYFDVVVGLDGEVEVVNPGARRIERYTPDGELDGFWGTAGAAIDAFFGCCNPAHLALLPDGRFVTSEKGIPRVKIYSGQGDFQSVVAGPEQLGVSPTALGDPRLGGDERVFAIATDTAGRVLVLDPRTRQVRIFVPKPSGTGVNG